VLRSPFAAIIRRAVAKPLEVRYRRASQMLADLRAVVDLMNKDRMLIASPDMEATQITAAHADLPIQGQTDMSEELRSVFNAMMDKEEQAPLTPHFRAQHAPPTLKQAVGDGPPTLKHVVPGPDEEPSSDSGEPATEAPSPLGSDGEGPATLVERSDDGRATLVDGEESDPRHTLVDEEDGEAASTLVDDEGEGRATLVDPEIEERARQDAGLAPGGRSTQPSATPSDEPPPPTLVSPLLDGPPTLPRAVPESTDSMPLLLTREPLDEQETVRIKVTKEEAEKLISQVPAPRRPYDSDGPTLRKARPMEDLGEDEPVPPTVASTPDPPVVGAGPAAGAPGSSQPAPQLPLGVYDPGSLELVQAPGGRRFPLAIVLLVVAALAVVLLFALSHGGG